MQYLNAKDVGMALVERPMLTLQRRCSDVPALSAMDESIKK